MSNSITIQNDAGYPADTDRLRQAAQTVLVQEDAADDASLTVVLTTNDAVHALNKQHRGVDAPTDVLSFPADPLPPEIDDAPYIGDLVIAYPYAKAQAQREGHPLNDSLALLVVHGTLHLLGYDHDTQVHRAAMWAAQETALTTLGIDPQIVPSLEASDHE